LRHADQLAITDASVKANLLCRLQNRDSYTLGMASQADLDQGGDVAPPSQDIRTAEFLGRRVAEVAQELSAGRAVLDRPAMRGVSGQVESQPAPVQSVRPLSESSVVRLDGDNGALPTRSEGYRMTALVTAAVGSPHERTSACSGRR
jgi:hypothetical protein